MAEILSKRKLNRATLARQMLLSRVQLTPVQAVERLGGMQAQEARHPFVGLWTRLHGFRREDLNSALRDRQIVRATTMRGTLHLMSARDYAEFRTTLQPMLAAGMQAIFKDRATGFEISSVIEQAQQFLGRGPAKFDEIRAHLAALNPDADPRALGYAVRMHLPLVIIPDTSEWSYSGVSTFGLASTWIAEPISSIEERKTLVCRYLAAFGPAAVADAEAWSGMRGLRASFEELRPELVTFRDERKRELFDLPDAPRPEEDEPAPVRFLPDFDNLVLSHADRSRVISDDSRKRIATNNLRIPGLFLVDGFVAGKWRVEQKKREAKLVIEPFAPMTRDVRAELLEEGERLLDFVAGTEGVSSVCINCE